MDLQPSLPSSPSHHQFSSSVEKEKEREKSKSGGHKAKDGEHLAVHKVSGHLGVCQRWHSCQSVRILSELLGVGQERGRTANCSLFLMHIGRFNLISTSNDILRKVKTKIHPTHLPPNFPPHIILPSDRTALTSTRAHHTRTGSYSIPVCLVGPVLARLSTYCPVLYAGGPPSFPLRCT